ncbi:MAG: 3D domain-containing protein [Candidatus Pristimantibacillus sp.]
MVTSFFVWTKTTTLLFVITLLLAGICIAPCVASSSNRNKLVKDQELQSMTKETAPALEASKGQEVTSVEVVATGYTAGVESTGKRPGHPQYGITYSGVKVRRGQVSTIAADTKLFPIGTILYIPGYGYGVVADTGSAIKGHKIDLYFETIKEVYSQWGKRKVAVQVLRLGSGKLSQTWLNNINRAVEAGKPIPQTYLES